MTAKWRCCRGEIGAETQDKVVCKICPQLNCAQPSQKWWKFLIAHVHPTVHNQTWSNETPCCQFSGKENKWLPMVPRFLLHDTTDMSIGGISGKRSTVVGRCWRGTSAGEALCILESLLCRGGPVNLNRTSRVGQAERDRQNWTSWMGQAQQEREWDMQKRVGYGPCLCCTDMHQRHVAWRSIYMQHGHVALTWSLDTQQGSAAWTCCVDIQQGHSALTCVMDMRHGHAKRIWSRGINHGHPA